MPTTDYQGAFDPTEGGVFVHAPKKDATAPLPVRLHEGQGDLEADQISSNETVRKCDSEKVFDSELLEEDIDYTAAPGRRHYIADVIKNQGISISLCAKRLGISQEEVLRQIDPKSNLSLRQLFDWSEALETPLPELLPFDASTSDPIRNRALLLRIMKTARQIQSLSVNTPVQYAAETLVRQLLELVPDFYMIEAWPTVGQSRISKVDRISTMRVDSETSRIIEDY